MTPANHYREAEKLAEQSYTADPEHAAYLVARAQVHATLALAGATALGPLVGYDTARQALGDAITGMAPAPTPHEIRQIIVDEIHIHTHDDASEALAGIAARVAREAGR